MLLSMCHIGAAKGFRNYLKNDNGYISISDNNNNLTKQILREKYINAFITAFELYKQ